MTRNRRSLLQAKILIQLGESPARSVSELADRLRTQRPSVSRSVKNLKEQGLIVRVNSEWRLTDAGDAELDSARSVIAETIEQTSKATERTNKVLIDVRDLVASSAVANYPPFNLDKLLDMVKLSRQLQDSVTSLLPKISTTDWLPPMTSMMDGISRSLETISPAVDLPHVLTALGPTVKYATSMQDLLGNVAGMAKVLGDFSAQYNSQQFRDALNPLLNVQRLNGEMLSQFRSSLDFVRFSDVLRQNNLLLSSAIDELVAVYQTDFRRSLSTWRIDLSWISEGLGNVNQAYGNLMSERFDQLTSLPALKASDLLVTPTVAVRWYVRSAHQFVAAETGQETLTITAPEQAEFGEAELDGLLGGIDPNLVLMRHGTWNAYNHRGPDWQRQASTSQRELLSHLLDHLAPADQLPQGTGNGPRIKHRVKYLLGKSEADAEYVEAMAVAFYESYRQHNKYTHGTERHAESLRAILHATEWLIYHLLSSLRK